MSIKERVGDYDDTYRLGKKDWKRLRRKTWERHNRPREEKKPFKPRVIVIKKEESDGEE